MSDQQKQGNDFRTTIGGQALMEGILMRGPKKEAIVCRGQDGLIRKVEELRLIKVLTSEGRYKYATVEKAESDLQERFIRLFSNCVVSITNAGNLIVIKTISGSASVAGEAIDSLKWPEIAGSIAGDNTIFVAVREGKNTAEIIKRFQKMMK